MTMPSSKPDSHEPDHAGGDLPSSPDRPRSAEGADRARGSQPLSLKVAVGLLVLLLIGGTVFVVRPLLQGPAMARAAERAPTSKPPASVSGLEAATALAQQGRFNEAAALLERIVEKSPTDQGARVAYAQTLIGLRRFEPAYEQYQAAVALLDPSISSSASAQSSEFAAVRREPVAAQLHFEAGTCATMAGRLDRALEHYWMAQTLDPGEAKYPMFLAMAQIKSGSDAEANVSLLRAVKLRPEFAEAWGTLAELALKANRLGLAHQHIEKARRLQPDSVRWRIVEARVLNRSHEPEKAALLLAALRDEQRYEPLVMTVLGESYGLLGRPADAAALYVSAAARAPGDAEINYQAALWLERAGEAAKAASYAKTAASQGHKAAADLLREIEGRSPGASE